MKVFCTTQIFLRTILKRTKNSSFFIDLPIEKNKLIVYTIKDRRVIMRKKDLVEFVNIENELEKLLAKFEELNKQTEQIKNEAEVRGEEETEKLLSQLETQYEIIDKKMAQLKERSDLLKNNCKK